MSKWFLKVDEKFFIDFITVEKKCKFFSNIELDKMKNIEVKIKLKNLTDRFLDKEVSNFDMKKVLIK